MKEQNNITTFSGNVDLTRFKQYSYLIWQVPTRPIHHFPRTHTPLEIEKDIFDHGHKYTQNKQPNSHILRGFYELYSQKEKENLTCVQ